MLQHIKSTSHWKEPINVKWNFVLDLQHQTIEKSNNRPMDHTIHLRNISYKPQAWATLWFNQYKLKVKLINKRPMGHSTHLRNQKSISTFEKSYDYIITLIRRKNPLSPFWEMNGPYLYNVEFLHQRIWCQLFWRRFLNFVNEFFLFRNYLQSLSV